MIKCLLYAHCLFFTVLMQKKKKTVCIQKTFNLSHVHKGRNGLATSCVPEVLRSHIDELLKGSF